MTTKTYTITADKISTDEARTNVINTDGYFQSTQKELRNLRGKYIKRLLSQLEPLDVVDVVVRKIILDALNDYARDVNMLLGYE